MLVVPRGGTIALPLDAERGRIGIRVEVLPREVVSKSLHTMDEAVPMVRSM